MPIFYEGENVNYTLPGVYIIESKDYTYYPTQVPYGIIGMSGVASWGPDDAIVTIKSVSDLIKYYGSRTTNLVKYAECAMQYGAGELHLLRVTGSGATKATADITAGTDTKWTLTAKYKGALGNDIQYQVVAGDLTDTVTLKIKFRESYETINNVTNDPTDANYIGKVFKSECVDFAKTGTAITLPTVMDDYLSLATGVDGADPTDGNLVTSLETFYSDPLVDLIAIAAPTTLAIRTGIVNHCDLTRNRIGFIEPPDRSTVDKVVLDAKDFNSDRISSMYQRFQYYNADTNAYEYLGFAGLIGKVAQTSPFKSVMNQNINGNFEELLSVADYEKLDRAHIVIGGNEGLGSYLINDYNEYRDPYWGTIMIRRTFDKIEQSIAAGLRKVIGFTGDLRETKTLIDVTARGILSYFQGIDAIQGFVVSTDKNTTSERMAGRAWCSIGIVKYPAVRYLGINIGRTDTGEIIIEEGI